MYTAADKMAVEPIVSVSRMKDMAGEMIDSAGLRLAEAYSWMMEEKVSSSQAWALVRLSLAFGLTFFPMGLELRLAQTGWLAYCIWDCKRRF